MGLEEVDRKRVLLGEDGDEEVVRLDGVLAGALHMARCAADHSPKADRRLGLGEELGRHGLHLVIEPGIELVAQLLHLATEALQHPGSRRVHEQPEEQVLHPGELVATLSRVGERKLDRDLHFLGELHSGSIVSSNGCPFARANRVDLSTFDCAISKV